MHFIEFVVENDLRLNWFVFDRLVIIRTVHQASNRTLKSIGTLHRCKVKRISANAKERLGLRAKLKRKIDANLLMCVIESQKSNKKSSQVSIERPNVDCCSRDRKVTVLTILWLNVELLIWLAGRFKRTEQREAYSSSSESSGYSDWKFDMSMINCQSHGLYGFWHRIAWWQHKKFIINKPSKRDFGVARAQDTEKKNSDNDQGFVLHTPRKTRTLQSDELKRTHNFIFA